MEGFKEILSSFDDLLIRGKRHVYRSVSVCANSGSSVQVTVGGVTFSSGIYEDSMLNLSGLPPCQGWQMDAKREYQGSFLSPRTS